MPTHKLILQSQDQAFSSGVANAAVASAVAPAVSGKTWYMTGVDVTTGTPNAAILGVLTISGLLNGSLVYTIPVANTAPAITGNIFSIRPPDPIPASGANVAVNASLASLGTGATDTVVTQFGFYA